MNIVVIVPFLNEERYLSTLLQSMSSQTRPPDCLLLVDDGSTDASIRICEEFVRDHPYATVLVAPAHRCGGDRLRAGAELRAFQWAVEEVDVHYDVVAKVDADVRLSPDVFAELERRFDLDPKLGIAGAHLSEVDQDGITHRLRCPAGHVQGATKFYRRDCFESISPLPAILGWDTIDEVRARMRGWRTQTFAMPSGEVVHLRPMGSHDGLLRGFRRAGMAAYGYGSSPLLVLLAAGVRLRDRPVLLGGVNFLLGWVMAAVRSGPRAEPELRAFVRREQSTRLRRVLSAAAPR